jgi:nucleoside-diphosphate-sugar epimerase
MMWGTGKPQRDFIYVGDVPSAFHFLLKNTTVQIQSIYPAAPRRPFANWPRQLRAKALAPTMAASTPRNRSGEFLGARFKKRLTN